MREKRIARKIVRVTYCKDCKLSVDKQGEDNEIKMKCKYGWKIGNITVQEKNEHHELVKREYEGVNTEWMHREDEEGEKLHLKQCPDYSAINPEKDMEKINEISNKDS